MAKHKTTVQWISFTETKCPSKDIYQTLYLEWNLSYLESNLLIHVFVPKGLINNKPALFQNVLAPNRR